LGTSDVGKDAKSTCLQTDRDWAPRIHNLIRLGELAGLKLQQDQIRFLGMANEFNIEGRYGDNLGMVPELSEAKDILQRVEEMVSWLNVTL
jgi:hypothetical protein